MKIYFCLLLVIFSSISQDLFSQGLKFNGSKEEPIDKRTSYNVFGNESIEFSGYFNIEFDLALYQTTRIGYIIRIKNQKSDKIYNLFYDGQGNNILFKFNEEGKNSLITARLNGDELLNIPWFKTIISFDLKNNSIKLTIHNQTFVVSNVGLPEKYYPTLIFGKSDYIIDVPTFALQNISIGNHEKKYTFALKENQGNVVHDSKGHEMGSVMNPEWLINDSYHWKFKTLFKSKSVAGANYFQDKKEIYYFNKDSIFIYNVRSGETQTEVFKKSCPLKLTLGTNFIDPLRKKLYAYEVYFDELNPNDPTIASLDLETHQWTPECFTKLPTQLHHHGSYYDADNHRYILFGGFGRMHYSNTFYVYNTESKNWDTLRINGDSVIFPRYFVSMGYQKKDNSLYIFGGMGNKSGEQVVGRKYFYDLYKVDLTTLQITGLWKIDWDKENVVPVRGMIIQDSCFYTLCYPEHYSNSFLRLYRFSMKDGSYKILGDSIPIRSDKITTNANLYFDNQLNTLYATVQEFDDDISSDIKVYSLSFPPITAEELWSHLPAKTNHIVGWFAIVLGLLLVCALGVFLIQKRLHHESTEAEEILTEPVSIKKQHVTDVPNSIYLFGEFSVYNPQKRDISYMFSSKIKQVFLLILQYSNEEGITSQKLSHLLWPDMPEAKVKNSRGVTINNLRKILKELDGIELIYDKGLYKIELSSNCYCDYERCRHIISTNLTGNHKEELLQILYRGKLLQSYDLSLFDQFKGSMEQKLEPLLLKEMKKSYNESDFITTIGFAEAMLIIDTINDEALAYLVKSLQRRKQNFEAQRRYLDFATHYKKNMGTDYPHSLSDLRI